MTENIVSVITPMYNAEKWIEETIATVQMQSYQKWEMIIVDDCSTDRSPEIVQKLQKIDARIKYYKNSENCGVAKSRNQAIQLSSGRYLAFLDSDDKWHPKKLELQIQKMQKEQIAFCYSACDVIDENGRKINVRYVPEKLDYKELLKGNVIPCLSVVLDRREIENISMPLIPHEDYATWLNILKNQKIAYGINEILGSYRIVDTSRSRNKMKAAVWTWNIYKNYLNMNFWEAGYYFCFYIMNAVKKYK